MKHSIFSPAWKGVLVFPLMLFVAPTSYADEHKSKAEQCFDAYMQSPAAPSCESSQSQTNVFINYEGMCEIADTCPTPEGQPRRSNITVSIDKADQVKNCDGVLKLLCEEPY